MRRVFIGHEKKETAPGFPRGAPGGVAAWPHNLFILLYFLLLFKYYPLLYAFILVAKF